MAEYIKKDDVLKIIKDIEMLYGKGSNDDEIISCISSIRGTDVIERKKGSWTKTTMTDFGYTFPVVRCTACGNVFSTFLEDVNFCPNCGADMRGET